MELEGTITYHPVVLLNFHPFWQRPSLGHWDGVNPSDPRVPACPGGRLLDAHRMRIQTVRRYSFGPPLGRGWAWVVAIWYIGSNDLWQLVFFNVHQLFQIHLLFDCLIVQLCSVSWETSWWCRPWSSVHICGLSAGWLPHLREPVLKVSMELTQRLHSECRLFWGESAHSMGCYNSPRASWCSFTLWIVMAPKIVKSYIYIYII